MELTHGNDPEALEAVADALLAESERTQAIAGQGRAGVALLLEAWEGPDVALFDEGWHRAEQQLDSVAQALRAVGRLARREAADQRTASEDEGGGAPFGPRGPGGPGSGVGIGGDGIRPDPDAFGVPGEYEDGPEIPFSSKEQVPQGLGYDAAHDELVYTFYDQDDDTDGEIVFVDRETGEVTSRVDLRGVDHYGGVYVDGEYTYVSGAGQVQVYRTEDLRDPDRTTMEALGMELPVTETPHPVDTVDTAAGSTVTVHDGDLYVTEWTKDEDEPGTMYRYEIGPNGSPIGEPREYVAPPQTQGVAFDEAGNAYFSSSYGRTNDSVLTRVSADDLEAGGWREENGDAHSLPKMAEGAVVIDGMLHVLYESGADKYGVTGPDMFGDALGVIEPRDRVTVHNLRK